MRVETLDSGILSLLPERRADAGKWDFGRALLIAGQAGMAGAAVLAARAAYRSGCGLCEILTPEENRVICQLAVPEAVLSLSGGASEPEALLTALRRADAAGIGPGLGPGRELSSRPFRLLSRTLEAAACPLVLDADALNTLAAHPALWEAVPPGSILTPHIREMARLTGRSPEEIGSSRREAAEALAGERRVVCVLKGRNSLITDGEQTFLNPTGNAGMATGGSGDVLTGILTSLLAQGLPALPAAALGVYLHGLAGDAAAEKKGQRSLMAGDIAEALPEVLKQY